MLPDSNLIVNNKNDNKAKFADTGIETLIGLMENKFNIDKSV